MFCAFWEFAQSADCAAQSGNSQMSDNLQIVAQSADCADWTICRLLNLNLWIGCRASSQQISVLVSKTIAQLARATFPGYAPPIQALTNPTCK